MPRRLSTDVHEWMNEILIVPVQQQSEITVKRTGLTDEAGKEDPIAFYGS